MSIRIVLGRSKTKAIDICRRWFFRSNGKWTNEEEAVIRDVVRGVPESPKTDGKNGFHLTDYLEDMQFVPAHIAPFFFFGNRTTNLDTHSTEVGERLILAHLCQV